MRKKYEYPFRVKHNEEYDVDLVDMKCLECGHEEEVELDILLECSNPLAKEAPALCCPACDHELLIPKDAYDQIKGGFVYKIEK